MAVRPITKITWSIRSLFSAKAWRMGLYSLVDSLARTCLNSSDSSVLERIHSPKKAIGRAMRNGMRHPHDKNDSLGIELERTRIKVPPKTEGSAVAARVRFSQSPRRLIGACSKTKAGAPTDSPPAEKP